MAINLRGLVVTLAVLRIIALLATLSEADAVNLDLNEGPLDWPTLPSFLQGQPEERQAHLYGPDVRYAPHTTSGEGLYVATVGLPASFTIHLAGEEGAPPPGEWNADGHHFIYVWIANADQIFIAEVVDNEDGTLTATYETSFPGQYSVHIEEVVLSNHDEGLPLVGSPFALTVSGDSALDVDSLPVCGTEQEDTESAFWRPGTWVSSNIASAEHGVARDGWVFQPKSCVYDMFSYEDLMLLAGLEEPTWLLVLGGSVQRGIFLTLVDMVLAQGQKDYMDTSILAKCWGYADIRVGNLRLTYQDLRLYRFSLNAGEDATVCNNEKLESGSTAMYLQSGKHFLDWVVFRDGADWPSVMLAPSHLVDKESYTNVAIEVVMGALPVDWRGSLIMADHMSGIGYHWTQNNPTMTSLADVGLVYHGILPTSDNGVGRMASYEDRDPRVSFMSVFPMYQAKLFENQNTKPGQRHYGGSIHYHFVSSNSSVGAYGGAKMVHSSITEMIANIIIGKAVGTKAMLYESTAGKAGPATPDVLIGNTFEMCTDCPSELLPFHVQPVPEPVCLTLHALPGDAPTGQVWDNELCPQWCLATDPVSQTPTEAGPVDVRMCPLQATGP